MIFTGAFAIINLVEVGILERGAAHLAQRSIPELGWPGTACATREFVDAKTWSSSHAAGTAWNHFRKESQRDWFGGNLH